MKTPEHMTAAEILAEVRAILAAISREADHRAAAEIGELARTADAMLAMLRVAGN